MTESEAAAKFTALAHETRLRLFRLLIVNAPHGLPAGKLAEHLAVAPNNLSAHLNVLSHAGLIAMRKAGRSRIYTARMDTIGETIGFLVDECCQGHPEACQPAMSALNSSC